MYVPSRLAPEPFPLPLATYRVRPSGESASALGSLPVAARGDRATASCSTTVPLRRSTRATAFAPASATYRSAPRSASAEGCGPTWIAVRRTGGLTDGSTTDTVESPQSLTYRCVESATAPYGRRPTATAPRRASVAASIR